MNDIVIVNDAEIIELARLQLAVDRRPEDQDLWQTLKDGLTRLHGDRNATLCMLLAADLLDRKGSGLYTDSPETDRRCRSIAAALGATVSYIEGGLFFEPASVH
jgi:hypothetical protein